jgi:hypothetical protein
VSLTSAVTDASYSVAPCKALQNKGYSSQYLNVLQWTTAANYAMQHLSSEEVLVRCRGQQLLVT